MDRRDTINARRRELYDQKHKDKKREYYENNKERISEYKREYREANKGSIIDKYLTTKYKCGCGKDYSLNHKARHLRSNYHMRHCDQPSVAAVTRSYVRSS